MAPTLFHLGPVPVQGYGFMIALGLITCFFMLSYEARRKGLDALARDIPSLYLWMLAAGFVGGKLFYFWTSPKEAAAAIHSGDVVGVIGNGFVFYGSLIFCLPTLWWWLRKRSLPGLRSIDVVILAAPVMLGTGRIGCFLGGCCYGSRCSGPLAVTFDHGRGLNHVPLHPAQLYETVGCYLVFAILWFFARHPPRWEGFIIALYFVLYGIERFVVECFRGDEERSFIIGGGGLKPGDPPTGISFSQGVSILFVLGGALWLWKWRKRLPPRVAPKVAARKVPA